MTTDNAVPKIPFELFVAAGRSDVGLIFVIEDQFGRSKSAHPFYLEAPGWKPQVLQPRAILISRENAIGKQLDRVLVSGAMEDANSQADKLREQPKNEPRLFDSMNSEEYRIDDIGIGIVQLPIPIESRVQAIETLRSNERLAGLYQLFTSCISILRCVEAVEPQPA